MTPYTLNIEKAMFKQIRRVISIIILVAFIATSVKSPVYAQTAQDQMPRLPAPGVMIHLSPEFTPAHLQGLTIHPDNALQFDFLIYRGDELLNQNQKKEQYTKLIKYFLASLTIPDEDQWVNLSPYEKNRIIKDDFGKTEMGRDLLAQDYILKQITSSLIYPEDNLGKKFWDKVYERAWREYHSTNIPVNTFNKIWIIPDEAAVYESGNSVYILRNHLKVMLEQDYLSLKKHAGNSLGNIKSVNKIGSQIVREIILPELEKEVNEGMNFANLRQIYSGMILATWYKHELKESLLGMVYANQAKVKGVDQNPKNNETIYRQYLKAFKKGVFNYIKEDADKYSNVIIPRKYFSGGAEDFASIVTGENVTAGYKDEAVLVLSPHTGIPPQLKMDMASLVDDKIDSAMVDINPNQTIQNKINSDSAMHVEWPDEAYHFGLLESGNLTTRMSGLQGIKDGLLKLNRRDRTPLLTKLSTLFDDPFNNDMIRSMVIEIMSRESPDEPIVDSFFEKNLNNTGLTLDTRKKLISSFINGHSWVNADRYAPLLLRYFYEDDPEIAKLLVSFFLRFHRSGQKTGKTFRREDSDGFIHLIAERRSIYWIKEHRGKDALLKDRLRFWDERMSGEDQEQLRQLMKILGMRINGRKGINKDAGDGNKLNPDDINMLKLSGEMQLAERAANYLSGLFNRKNIVFLGVENYPVPKEGKVSTGKELSRILLDTIEKAHVTDIAIPIPVHEKERFEKYLRGEIPPNEWDYNDLGHKRNDRIQTMTVREDNELQKSLHSALSSKPILSSRDPNSLAYINELTQMRDIFAPLLGKVKFIYYGIDETKGVIADLARQEKAKAILDAAKKNEYARILVYGRLTEMSKISTVNKSTYWGTTMAHSVAEEIISEMGERKVSTVLLVSRSNYYAPLENSIESGIEKLIFGKAGALKMMLQEILPDIFNSFGLDIKGTILERLSYSDSFKNPLADIFDGFVVWDKGEDDVDGGFSEQIDAPPGGGKKLDQPQEPWHSQQESGSLKESWYAQELVAAIGTHETNGGIDLNSANLNLQIKRDGKGVPLPLIQQDMAQLSRIQGFIPEIIEIKPAVNLPILNELQQKQQPSSG